jgi:xylose isomerase
VMYYILKNGGMKNGGNNFDAKVRRQSVDAVDLFYGHIGGIDILARSLLNAAAMIEGGEVDSVITDRYAGWQSADAKAMLAAGSSLEAISDAAVAAKIDPKPRSGRQEYVENIVSRYI